jgi:hypothetical protein
MTYTPNHYVLRVLGFGSFGCAGYNTILNEQNLHGLFCPGRSGPNRRGYADFGVRDGNAAGYDINIAASTGEPPAM